MSDKKKNEKSPFAGALADKLKNLDIDTSAKADPAKREPAQQKPAQHKKSEPKQAQPDQAQPDQAQQEQEPLSERELFEKAVAELDRGDVYSGKFQGVGPELPPEPEDGPSSPDEQAASQPGSDKPGSDDSGSDQQAREAVAEKREIRQFERAVGPVDKKNVRRRKYRQPTRPSPAEHVKQVASYRSDSPADMITPPLPKSGDGLNNVGPLVGAQKEMLDRFKKRSRRHEVPEISVRGDSVEDALRQIELFVHQQWKQKAHFVRIIHGRGLQSDGDPVLKPAVLRWLEGPGYRYIKGYVPDVNPAGDYGSVIAELVPQPNK